ncbi:hypothetical protein JRO89_XS03G0072500 [Xanthoceras sorbifolium]|uniref:Uncharacterized protein n=1 Tax=Xanthoceras sorbifolium TaxID=99658 RepID=A0ABQ8I907_9ROSI|nr:hypothetical protein JRO89_XS03G0072500 [Xanthoceras sorbifolium]
MPSSVISKSSLIQFYPPSLVNQQFCLQGLFLFLLNSSLWPWLNYDIFYIIGIVLLAVGDAGIRPLLREFLVYKLRMHEPAANTNINDDGVNDPQEDQVDDDGVEDRAEAHMEDPLEDRVDDDRVEDRAEAHVEDPAEDRVNDDRVEDRVEAHMEDSPENRVDDDGVKDPMKAPAEDRVDDDGVLEDRADDGAEE